MHQLLVMYSLSMDKVQHKLFVLLSVEILSNVVAAHILRMTESFWQSLPNVRMCLVNWNWIVLYCVTSSLPHAKRELFNTHRSKEKWKRKYTKEDQDVYMAVV